MMGIARNRLRALREKSRLTLEEVAKLTDMDATTIARHEGHSRGLSGDAILKYAKVYKVHSHELFILADVPREQAP